MQFRRFVILLATICICGTCAMAQDDPGRGRGRGRGPDDPPPPPPGRDDRGGPPPPPRISPEQRALQQLRQLFASDDAEWSVLGPKIERIQTLTRERERLTHLRPPPPPRPDQQQQPDDPSRNALVVDTPPDLQRNPPKGQANIRLAQIFREMATLASSSSSSAAQLKEALDHYRAARVQAEKEIAAARAELRDLVTPRQEVILVLSGILD